MSPARSPLISVCIPSFNNERFIEAAIRSVLEQTLGDFELIVSDDLSTDRTRELVRAFSDARIRLIENDRNLGQEGNWNKVLTEIRGRFVKLLPGDDLLYPQCLERQWAVFRDRAADDIALVSCARDVIDERGRKILRRSFPGKGTVVAGREAVRRSVRAGTNLIGEPAAVLMRADLIARAGGFNGENIYVIDLDYWTRMLLQGGLAAIFEPLCAFRVSGGAVSTRIRKTQALDFRKFLDRIGQDPAFGLTREDLMRGRVNSAAKALLRRFAYRFVFSR